MGSCGAGAMGLDCGAVVGHPLLYLLQQYAFLETDQPICELLSPALQS